MTSAGIQKAQEEVYFAYSSMQEDRKWLSKCWVSMFKSDFTWEDNGEEMSSECGNQIKLSHTGDNDVLIQNLSQYLQDDLIKEMGEWFKYWFVCFRP